MVLDTTGVDLYPLIQRAVRRYDVPTVAVLAMLIAESGLNPRAERWGVHPDISFGLSQITIETAKGYGLGDGTLATALSVRTALFNRATAVDLGTRHLAGNLAYVRERKPQQVGDALLLDALRVYNGGGGALDNPAWEARWAANVASYRVALRRAHELLEE